jgi:geranylgeranyl diphosphate synthase type I
VGDIAFFVAFDLLSFEDIPNSVKVLFTKILTSTGLAQIQDVYYGMTKDPISFEDIITMYCNKTARYTFSLPLCAGALLSGASASVVSGLDIVGKLLGIIFQLKDDQLGMFGNKQEIGKVVGDDIVAGKKTPYHYYLYQCVNTKEHATLDAIFGNKQTSMNDIAYVQKLCYSYGVDKKVEQELEKYGDMAQKAIEILETQQKNKQLFLELLNFSLTRKK